MCYACLLIFTYKSPIVQTCIDSIFPEGHDVNTCILHAADSIGLKDIPNYEVKKGEQYDWIRKTQVNFLFLSF